MTLEEVAKRMREEIAEGNPSDRAADLYIVEQFESDPDFGLRGRVEELIRQWVRELGHPPDRHAWDRGCRIYRLREALDPKEGRT